MQIDDRESLIIHIEGLQATLTKRNARIAVFGGQLRNPEILTEQAKEREYRRGWEACASHLMGATLTLARELGKTRKEAFEAYIAYDRLTEEP